MKEDERAMGTGWPYPELLKHIIEIKEEIAELRARVEALEAELRRRNSQMKTFVYIYIVTLSFLAAVLGVRWVAP